MFDERNKKPPIEWQGVSRATIANDLKSTRERLGISQEEAAHNANISPRTLQRYESGERSIPIEKWLTLQNVLVKGYVVGQTQGAASPVQRVFSSLAKYLK